MFPKIALAHNFGSGKGAYEEFLSGNQAVFVDFPVVLGTVATGILIGIWKSDGLPKVWAFFLAGIAIGIALGLSGVIPPVLPAYLAVCILGLVGAASPKLTVIVMRVVAGLMGVILANAVLSGHEIGEVKPLAFIGIVFALNLGLAMSAGIVAIAQDNLQFGWVKIAWRALMSWLVAISIMAMVLMLKTG